MLHHLGTILRNTGGASEIEAHAFAATCKYLFIFSPGLRIWQSSMFCFSFQTNRVGCTDVSSNKCRIRRALCGGYKTVVIEDYACRNMSRSSSGNYLEHASQRVAVRIVFRGMNSIRVTPSVTRNREIITFTRS
jgi:hypothetical protein